MSSSRSRPWCRAARTYHFLVPHGKRLTAYYPCNDGLAPSRAAVIKLAASGALPWDKTISHVVDADDVAAFYGDINEDKLPELLGAVIRW